MPGKKSNSQRKRPLVFISHDSRDAEIAAAFGMLLDDASIGTVKVFCSSDKQGPNGIPYGAEWFAAIQRNLEAATDVVAILTPTSVTRHWILFEVGFAKRDINTPVLGVAMGISLEKISNGPFALLQNSDSDEDSLTKLVLQLIRRNPDASPKPDLVRRHVKEFLVKIEPLLEVRRKAHENDESLRDVNGSDLLVAKVDSLQDLIKSLIHTFRLLIQNFQVQLPPETEHPHE